MANADQARKVPANYQPVTPTPEQRKEAEKKLGGIKSSRQGQGEKGSK